MKQWLRRRNNSVDLVSTLPKDYKVVVTQLGAIAQQIYQTAPLPLEVYSTPPRESRDPNQPIANFRCVGVAPEEARFSGSLLFLKSLSKECENSNTLQKKGKIALGTSLFALLNRIVPKPDFIGFVGPCHKTVTTPFGEILERMLGPDSRSKRSCESAGSKILQRRYRYVSLPDAPTLLSSSVIAETLHFYSKSDLLESSGLAKKALDRRSPARGGSERASEREREREREREIARNKARRFVADTVANGCAVTGPHSTEPRMRDATHSIVFYILPGRFSPPWYS
ncbi:hypothetical protein WN51_07767 [Melipona quadrifasciata]|uniref:Uncharacterized protein n=1 Tax=Melipona quadrifasciata TaxID=166423 RepID=A0A0N0BIY0_9HYME|nr:hypothetical protein WN51_07767 [Melipona quadrifasciata]